MPGPQSFIDQIGQRMKLPLGLVADQVAQADTQQQERLERRIADLSHDIEARPPARRFFRH